jgi:uncharacterized protein YkwD
MIHFIQLDTSIDFINAAADVINKLRDYHQVGPLTINMTVGEFSLFTIKLQS